MLPWWWMLIFFFVGGLFGCLITVVLIAGSDQDE